MLQIIFGILHIDFRAVFLQGQRFHAKRDVVCQLPVEAGLPSYNAARLKRAAYGWNDAPRLCRSVYDFR